MMRRTQTTASEPLWFDFIDLAVFSSHFLFLYRNIFDCSPYSLHAELGNISRGECGNENLEGLLSFAAALTIVFSALKMMQTMQ